MWRAGRDWLAGAVLVFVGLLLLAERRMPELVPAIPLIVGLGVLVLTVIRRSPTALLVGCTLTGAGIGVLLDRDGSAVAGVAFPASVAAGLTVAWLLGLALRMPSLRAWPLLGALVSGAIAVALAVSGAGDTARRVAVAWWPLAVIALGVLLLLGARVGARAGRRAQGPDDETRPYPVVSSGLG